MTQPNEERSLRTVRSGFSAFTRALDYVSLLFAAEYEDAQGVQAIIEQEPEGTWSVMIYGTRSVDSTP
jgi:hypothetical protein